MKKIVGLAVAGAIASALIGWGEASAQVTDSYQVANTETRDITAHGYCARISNSSGKTLFVPTKTLAEWNSFRTNANPPAGVTVSSSCGCAAAGGCPASSEGAVCTTYSASSATSPTTCSSLSVTATCSNGSWTPAPATYGSCAQSYRSCAASGGCSASAHGTVCTTYSSSAPSGASCSTVSRSSTCSDGTWSAAPYAYGSCSSGCAASGACSAASNGASCTTYSSGSVGYPSSCSSVSRSSTCSNGSWSVAPYSYGSCSVSYSYYWNYSGWGSCSSSCGSGSQSRSVWCERSDGASVSDSYCSGAGAKPGTSNSCSDYSGCSYSWNYGGWGSCSVSCGGGSQSRSVWCQRSDGSSVSDAYCGGGKPSTSQSCNTHSCYTYDWAADGWSSCSAQCGGTQTRNVWCRRSDGASVDPATYCFSIPPASSQSCNGNGTSCSACNGAGCNYGTCSGSSCNAQMPYYCWSSPGGCIYGTTAGSPAGQNICQASDPSYYGQSCSLGTSAANACGQTQACTGTRDCANNCVGSCSPPPNTCTFNWRPASCPSYWYTNYEGCGYSPYYGSYYMYYKYFTFECYRSTDNATVSSSLCGTPPSNSVCEAKCDYHN